MKNTKAQTQQHSSTYFKSITVNVGSNRGTPRVWLQGLNRYGWQPGEHVHIDYRESSIVITRDPEGRRKITAPSKGGVLDLMGSAVADVIAAMGSPDSVTATITPDTITINS